MARPTEGWELRPHDGRNGNITVRFTIPGKGQYEKSTGTRDPVEAAKRAAEIYAVALLGGGEKRGRGGARVDPTLKLDELFALWLEAIEKTHDAETVKTYTQYAKRFVKHFGPTLIGISRSALGDYQRARLTQILRRSLQKEQSALNKFLDWCEEKELMREELRPKWPRLGDRVIGKRSGKQREKPVDVTVDQVRAFLLALPLVSRRSARTNRTHVVRARFVFMYETGLRPATISALSVPEHWESGAAELQIPSEDDKSRFGRKVPLSPAARAALEAALAFLSDGRGLLFGSHDYREHVERARKLAKLPKGFAPYDLRHGRAGHLLDASTDMRGVAFLLGHRRLTTTDRYLRAQERQARTTLDAAGSRGDLGDTLGQDVVRRKGLEPLQELPHWNLNPAEVEETSANPDVGHGQEGPQNPDEGQGSRGPLELPPAVDRATNYLAVLRAEWDPFDRLALEEICADTEGES